MILIDTAQQFRGPITCPYHSWTYDLDGSLRKTPHVGGPDIHQHPSVNHCDYPLNAVRTHVWHDVVFVKISSAAAAFDDYAAELIDRWSEFEHPIYHGGADSSFRFTLNCNWKLAVENFCESYHLLFIHPGLNSYSRLEDHYSIVEAPNYAGQGTIVHAPQVSADGRKFQNFEGLSAKWDSGAEYLALFPNVLLGIHRDHYFAIILTPDGPEKPPNRSSSITRHHRSKAAHLTICGPSTVPCGTRYLPRIFEWLRACRKFGTRPPMMAVNFLR
jgi:phenylpropionate dioxygenase-like ring-hydroxylating dioxygenase large terminal subunit